MILSGKYYDYLNPITNERTLSTKGALDLIKMLDNYNNMIECGLNSHEDKLYFVNNILKKENNMIKHNDIRIDRKKLHPWLNYKLDLLLKKCNKKGIYLIITEGFRTVEYQDNLYAKGRTKSGNIVTYARGKDYQSQHQWGIAFDIAINDTKLLYDVPTLKKVAKIAKAKGVRLAWGGDWVRPVDMPHFYLKKWGDTTSTLKSIYKTPEKFRREWIRTVRGTKRGLNIWNKSHTKVLRKKVPNGNEVNVMYIKGKCAKVEYLGTVGYMKVKYLK